MSHRLYTFLEGIRVPADLKKLSLADLNKVSRELRDFIIDEVSANPGHFGASLGVVELTVALHYVFNQPEDKIIWDVGHQAYVHKILTGRKDLFHTNRKKNGISGFPKMEESEYDSFGAGHASISISAALGIALANNKYQQKQNHVIAVIGDGALTGGIAFEGLNNAGIQKTNLLVILNDNNISIDPNVGAISKYLIDITTSRTYNKARNDIWNFLGSVSNIFPNARKYGQKFLHGLKSVFFRRSNLFESLNFRYFGPVDGHDINRLVKIMEDLKYIKGPKLLHVVTTKGKGFKHAENNQTVFHSPGLFNKETGDLIKKTADTSPVPRYQDVFGHTLLELARMNERIVGITPAMPTGSSLKIMMDALPERCFDVGIAEQHAVTFAAGLASQGMIPYCTIYSTFAQRAYDQVIHDVALQKLQVVLCLDRCGLTGQDGATHHGIFDIAALRCIPGITFCSPMDEKEFRHMLFTAQLTGKGPFVIRYPKGRGISANWRVPFEAIEIGKGRKIKTGTDMAILSIGHVGNFVLAACQELPDKDRIAHYDMRFIKPMDETLLHNILRLYSCIITVEDGVVTGGFGSAVLEFMATHGYKNKVVRLGIPDRFVDQGTQEELYSECGYHPQGILRAIENCMTELRPAETTNRL